MKYIIRKPKNTKESPVWIDEMDDFDGMIIDAKNMTLTPSRNFKIDFDRRFRFNKKWIKEVHEKEGRQFLFIF